ncbi:MAG: hypothetical protein ACK4MV_07410 [Beijerinckiaceae bacterium]
MTLIAASRSTRYSVRPRAGLVWLAPLAALCVCLPLATWAVAIALFGLPHVLMEMRYVAHRFGVRLRSLAWLLGPPLLLAIAARAATALQLISPERSGAVELVSGASLALVAVCAMKRRRATGALLAAAIVAGAYVSAPATLLILALLHNFTPVALLADAAPTGRKAATAFRAAAIFLLPPLVLLTGLPFALLDTAGWTAPHWSPLPAGQLDTAIAAYVPPIFAQRSWALDAFSAAVMAQCLHYYATIRVLPAMTPPHPRDRFAVIAFAFTSAILTGAFVMDYATAKTVYGIAALAHAWIEIPVLLLALDAAYDANTSPAAKEAPFADRDSASARAAEAGNAIT